MNWRFTLITSDGTSHPIDEPAGWDALEIELKRDADLHGVFLDYSGNDFQFYDKALRIIEAEFEANGIQANITVLIEWSCDDDLVELYRGKLLFSLYDKVDSDECYASVPLEATSDAITLMNNWAQKVNLETLVAFDGTTLLPKYAKLGFRLDLPSKAIQLFDNSNNAASNATDVLGATEFFNTYGYEYSNVEIGFDTEVSNEFGLYGFPSQPLSTKAGSVAIEVGAFERDNGTGHFDLSTPVLFPTGLANGPVWNYARDTANFGTIGTVNLSFSLTGKITVLDAGSNSGLNIIRFYFLRKPYSRGDGTHEVDYDYIMDQPFYDVHMPGSTGATPSNLLIPGQVQPFNISFSDANFPYVEGDMLYMFFHVFSYKAASNADLPSFNISFDAGSFFKMETLSKVPDTDAKVFAINETLSRITEAITNDKLRVYSDYFGRKDAEPYKSTTDGDGSLAVITEGLFIRQMDKKLTTTPPLLNISMADAFAGLNPIHNMGAGLENDPNRNGKLLRIEPWHYFYTEDIVMQCIGVNKIERKLQESEHFATFSFGYSKWEAQEYTGLDEFLTKRTYRTTLTQVKNTLEKISTFIASGYALEVTRRKGNTDSTDWQYDNDVFIIACKRSIDTEFVSFYGPNQIEFYYNHDFFFVGGTFTVTNADISANNQKFTVTALVNTGSSWLVTVNLAIATQLYDVVTLNDGFEVEQGNISGASNIVDPPTIYNFRYTPLRNALRWMVNILSGYRTFDANSKIIFTDGDGNYYAAGDMISALGKMENGNLAENQSLDINNFADINDGMPWMRPGRVTFTFPMSVADYLAVAANPKGLIRYMNDSVDETGWIDDIKYKPEAGTADFTLIPKRPAPSALPPPTCVLVYIIGNPSLPVIRANKPYNYSFSIAGTAPYFLSDEGLPSWMNISLIGNVVSFSGTPSPSDVGYTDVSFNINNCGGLVTFNGSVHVTDAPSLFETSNTNTGPGGRTTQVFAVGASVEAGDNFYMMVYSHILTVIAVAGDTPTTIASKMANAINLTTESQWGDTSTPPAHGTNGFPPSATPSTNTITTTLDYQHSFGSGAN